MRHRLAEGLLTVLTLPLLLTGCSRDESADPTGSPSEPSGAPTAPMLEPVAEVGGATITDADLAERVEMVTSDADVARAIDTSPETGRELRAGVLSGMVAAALVAQAAPELGVRVSEDDLEAYLDEIAAAYLGGGDDAWARYLTETGYPESQVRAQLREDLVRERVEDALDPDARASAEEVRAVYAEGYAGRPQVAHVLVATREQADRLHARLLGGAEIADLARSFSLDAATAQSGGELGPWIKGEYTPSFDEAVEDATVTGPGVLPVVSSPFGWHVIEVRAPATLEEVAGEIADSLVEEQQDQAYLTWLAGLQAEAPVWIRADHGRWDATSGTVVAQ